MLLYNMFSNDVIEILRTISFQVTHISGHDSVTLRYGDVKTGLIYTSS